MLLYVSVMLGLVSASDIFKYEYVTPDNLTRDTQCNSVIFCQGDFFNTMMKTSITEANEFLELSCIHSLNKTLERYEKATKFVFTPKDIMQFIEDNFEAEPALAIDLDDWKSVLKLTTKIGAAPARDWAMIMNGYWKKLARGFRPALVERVNGTSFLAMAHKYVTSGGRMHEVRYVDSYWVVCGLLASEMYKTVRGMLDNFVDLIRQFGFIPYGSRKYHLDRAAAPLFAMMVDKYMAASSDFKWIETNIGYVDQELQFWLRNRTIYMNHRRYVRYKAYTTQPRTEHFRADTKLGGGQALYTELNSITESGWESSTRWYADPNATDSTGAAKYTITNTVPVDLNAIFCGATRLVSTWYMQLGSLKLAEKWKSVHEEWVYNVYRGFWNDTDQMWYDIDRKTGKARHYFYSSGIYPLWTMCVTQSQWQNNVGEQVARFMQTQGLLDFEGGVPTSLQYNSTELWDFPQVWASEQAMMVDALLNAHTPNAEKAAHNIAIKWLQTTYFSYSEMGVFYSTYDCQAQGERSPRFAKKHGVGVSIGVTMYLMQLYGETYGKNAKAHRLLHDRHFWEILLPVIFILIY